MVLEGNGSHYQHEACGELCFIHADGAVFFNTTGQPQGVCPVCKVAVTRELCRPVSSVRAPEPIAYIAERYVRRQLFGA